MKLTREKTRSYGLGGRQLLLILALCIALIAVALSLMPP